jgi:hypothetical protein
MRVHALALLVLASIGSAQTTWIVGPGGFATIQEAIDTAAAGDVIVVRPGNYANFSCTRSVTIRGDGTGSVSVGGPFFSLVQLLPGERFTLADLRFDGLLIFGGFGDIDCCVIAGTQSLNVISTRLVMQGCSVTPSTGSSVGLGQGAIVATNSEVHAVGGTFVGPDQQSPLGGPSPGVRLVNSLWHGADLVVRGGAPLPSGPTASPAILADATSRVWISDSVLTASPGACTIEASIGGHDRCSLSPACSTLPATSLLGSRRLQPIRLGQVLALEFRNQPGIPVVLWTDIGLGATTHPLLAQPVLLPSATARPLTILVTNAAGLAAPAWLVPNVIALRDQEVWIQAVAATTFPLPVSPVAGGLIR